MAVPIGGRFGLWPFRFVAISVCGRFGLWPFRSVAVSVCGRFGLWPFRFVAVSVCGRLGFGRLDLWPLWAESTAHVQYYHLTVTCRGGGYSQDDCNCRLFAITDLTKSVSGSLWYQHVMKTTQIAYYDLFQLNVTWRTYRSHHRGYHGANFLIAVTYGRQSNLKSLLTKPPVKLAQM